MMIRKTIILITGFFLFAFFLSGLTNLQVKMVLAGYGTRLSVIEELLYDFSELLTKTKQFIWSQSPSLILNKEIPNGIKFYSDNKQYENYHLLTSFQSEDEYIIELVNIENGKTIKEWIPNLGYITELTSIGKNHLIKGGIVNVLRHPIMTKDSSIIAGTGYSLVKLGKNSNIVWVKSDYEAHHSIELDHEKNIWIAGRRFTSKLKGFFIDDIDEDYKSIFLDDLIMKINPENGDVIFEKSFIQILKDNNLYDLVNVNGKYDNDPIHLNDVKPALTDGGFWKKGDLLISARNLSAVFLYRPSENKVLWYKQGPWLNQHDSDFLGKNKISVFGNQIYRKAINFQNILIKHPYKFNSVFVYNFENDSITEPFKKFIESEKIKTIFEGRQDILPNGDLFIEETESGRIFIGDTIKKKVSFSRRLDENLIHYLHWSRIIIN